MTNKSIIEIKDLEKLTTELNKKKLGAVLAGGCFDIIHAGHIDFLEKAKKLGDKLIILLESDESIKKKKGLKRPINNQKNRALVLSYLKPVDYVITLPLMSGDEDYKRVINLVKPNIIALSSGDINIVKKRQEAKEVGVKIKIIKQVWKNISSSRIIEMIESKTIL